MKTQYTDIILPEDNEYGFDRRQFMAFGLGGLLASMAPLILPGQQAQAAAHKPWRLTFRHGHTGEVFSGVYRVGDKYLPEAFERINYVMRDFRTNEAFPMDPRVIDIIAQAQEKSKAKVPMQVLSGYRSPKTNRMLRNASTGVARNSFHMYGQAIDVRIPGYSTHKLRNHARSLKAGGVGYYPKSGFVHVDTGNVRSW